MENLNKKVVGLTLGTTSTIVYVICSIWYNIAPKSLIGYGNYLFHGIDLDSITSKTVTFSSIIIGLVLIFISGYLIGTLFAMLYNYFNKK